MILTCKLHHRVEYLSALKHHFTASGLVLTNGHVLLVNHKRIGAWVPPGGHVEDLELPEQTVVREIKEETGIQVEVLSDPSPPDGGLESLFLKSPLYLQRVKAREKGGEFYHIDLAFLCLPLPGSGQAKESSRQGQGQDFTPQTERQTGLLASDKLPPLVPNGEVKEARWVKLSELDSLPLAENVAAGITLASAKLRQLGIEL